MTMRARHWLGSFPALLRDRRALLGIAIDAVLIGAGLAMAAGAIGFAGLMVVEGNHKPDVFGLIYFAIYAQPHRTAKSAGETGPSPEPPLAANRHVAGRFDPRRSAGDRGRVCLGPARPRVAARGIAHRRGEAGDVRAGLGRIVDLAQRDGRWFLVGESGTALLSSEPPAAKDGSARAPFNRQMIFGDK